MKITVTLPFKPQTLDLENIEHHLLYEGIELKDCRYLASASALEMEVSAQGSEADIREKILALIEKVRPFDEKQTIDVLFDLLQLKPPYSGDVFQELKDRGDIFQHAPGIFSYSGLYLQLMEVLDQEVKNFALKEGAQAVSLPVSTPIADLQKSDFFKHTPQFAQFISCLPPKAPSISEFSQALELGKKSAELKSLLDFPELICRSAICLSAYPRYAHKMLAPHDYFCLTSMGKSFRHEGGRVSTMERLQEFTMREIIYFGDAPYVQKKMVNATQWFKDFMQSLELQGVIQMGDDSFFVDHAKSLQFYQRSQKSKYEVRLVNPHLKRQVACGSLNFHGSHFAHSFSIKLNNGQLASTGCVGFGLERLVFLILSQYGSESTCWPVRLKNFFQI